MTVIAITAIVIGGLLLTGTSSAIAQENQPPVAQPDIATTFSCDDRCLSVTIPVLANDRDPDGDSLAVTAIERQPSSGTAVINADNTITYTPNPRFSGEDTFSYSISDGTATATATVTVKVVDRTPPTISNVPAPIRVEATSSSGTTVTYPTPIATDTVDTSVLVNCDPKSGSLFPIGTTTVTCTAIDSAGNTASATFTVTVVPPVTICHIPPGNPENAHAITVSESDAQNHIQRHGDFVIDSTHPCPPS